MAEAMGSGKTTDFRSVLCRTHLPRMARATNSCTPRWFGRRTALVLLADFWYFSSQKSMIKEKLLYDSIRRQQALPCLGDADTHASHMCQSPPCTFSGRADNACTNPLGYFVRYVRTRGIVEAADSVRLPTFALPPCRTHLPRMTCATNSCTRKEIFKRMENPLK